MPGNPLQQREIAAATSRALPLSFSGVVAALVVGSAALFAGLEWAALLIAFFVAATAVSGYRSAVKRAHAGELLEKSGPRDAWQVLANGGAFAAGTAALAATGSPAWAAFAAGSLAAASADTWATELGLLSRRSPRSILTGSSVPPGTSGGVTLAGTAAGAGGALVVAILTVLLRTGVAPTAIFTGGLAGMLLDSLLGATVQEQRRCPRCGASTERRTHSCGTATLRSGGVAGLNNDVVNAVATISGGLAAMVLTGVTG